MKTELSSIFCCNFYLNKTCYLAYTIYSTSPREIPRSKSETKFNFPLRPQSFKFLTWIIQIGKSCTEK